MPGSVPAEVRLWPHQQLSNRPLPRTLSCRSSAREGPETSALSDVGTSKTPVPLQLSFDSEP